MSSQMRKYAVAAGQKFNRLTAVEPGPRNKNYGRRWHCRCACGQIVLVDEASLHTGATKSCGCWRREMQDAMRRGRRGPGRGDDGKRTPTYSVWTNMKTRCLNRRNAAYPLYGGRGIKVCERWMKFENFLADMGDKPEGKSLDRIDVNGNYEPGNCRWATANEQARNQRTTRLNDGVRALIDTRLAEGALQREVAAELGIHQTTVSDYVRRKTWRPEGEPRPARKRAAKPEQAERAR